MGLDAFAELDALALQPLPLQTWELAMYKTVRAHIEQHVEFEGHRYSVPHSLVSLALEARITARGEDSSLRRARRRSLALQTCAVVRRRSTQVSCDRAVS